MKKLFIKGKLYKVDYICSIIKFSLVLVICLVQYNNNLVTSNNVFE